MTNRDLLTRLASLCGVESEYWGFSGQRVEVADSTLIKVLDAMGIDAGSDVLSQRAIDDRTSAPWREALPPCTVIREGAGGLLPVHVPDGEPAAVTLEEEQGSVRTLEQAEDNTPPREVDGVLTGQASFVLPADLPLGYHTIHAVLGNQQCEAQVVVVPQRIASPSERNITGWGVMAQLYSVRSRQSWGIGDTDDLRQMCSLFGDEGGDFLLINPLHAAEPVGHMTPSPYLPVTRRFFNPIYIRPEDIPEVAYMSAPQRALVTWAGRTVKAASLKNETIDRDAAWSAKFQALEVIFAQPRSQARQRAFERYCAFEGQGLADFALWCALREKYGTDIPETLTVDSPHVDRERRELASRIEFFSWLQWIMDQQLEAAQRDARNSGMELGIIHDLAVGVHGEGSDVWSLPTIFAAGVGVGAPPDMYNQQGQNWSQPPWRPDALRSACYAPLRDMVRTVLRHAGGLRIDHIMGLFRLWWVPDGNSPAEGAYVRYDHEAMVGIVMLEAQRFGAVLVGEDLGIVEPWVRDYLKDRGILGTSVLWFERNDDGTYKQPWEFRRETLVTVDTHDLPPAAGYLALEHVDLRERLGLLTEPVETVRAEAQRERELMIERLREHGLIDADPTEREVIEALHRYIAKTPGELLAVSLVDAVGERRAQNQPGTNEEYPNWRVPLADGSETVVLVEELATHPRLTSLMSSFTAELRDARS